MGFFQHWRKLAAFTCWVAIILSCTSYMFWYNLGPLEVVQQLIAVLRTPVGPLLLLVLFALNSVLFVPLTSVLIIAAGSLYGPIMGTLLALVGFTVSSLVAYAIGHWFGQGVLDMINASGIVRRYTGRLYRNSFETVLLLRLLYLPFDAESYLAGVLRIRFRVFVLASFLGSIPMTISLALAGSSVSIETQDGLIVPDFDPRMLALAVVIFLVSLSVSHYLRRRDERQMPS